jgi:hypothetical protein
MLLLNGAARAGQTDILGPAGSSRFGIEVKVLPNGNFVVTDPGYSVPGGAANVGAVYLYDGSTLQLISRLTGSTPNDEVGAGGIVVLSNGNYVVSSASWDNQVGPAANAGAVTWCSATTGCDGLVSASNSLIGSRPGDQVGRGTVTRLTNGHYVVSIPSQNHGEGAVTWGNGATGTVGVVSLTNSLIGSSPTGGAITELSNGNYVVSNIYWDAPGILDAGAVTWCNGNGGTVGQVSSGNSLIGSTANDNVGRVTKLTNGNYVVSSGSWDNPTGPLANVGAVTWGNGNGGTVGLVTSSNSLIGGMAGDEVGSGSSTSFRGVTPLTNSNYVVSSPLWDNPSGPISNVGAVTWANGNGATIGVVSATNSLIGGTANDRVGGTASDFGDRGDVTALTNGNYVVSSCSWDNPTEAKLDVGAITWGSGSGGTIGLVGPGNSLLGSTAGDQLGNGGVTSLTNGNFVVSSRSWDNPTGPVANAGAATWGNGSGATVGVIKPDNSLIGGTAGDGVGMQVTALTNGNYVVHSGFWDNPTGPVANAGAVTWSNGNGSTVGLVTSSNSLVGGTANDYVGERVMVLSNGNYVVRSSAWNNPIGPAAAAGAVTWGNGNGGTVGLVGPGNSLVGGTANDRIGFTAFEDVFYVEITTLTNGNYVVTSPSWDDPAGKKVDAGAVTWGNGNGGTVGLVTSSNSLIGGSPADWVGGSAYNGFDGVVPEDPGGVAAFTNGNYVVDSPFWTHPNGLLGGAVTLGNGTSGTAGLITSANSVMGTSPIALYSLDIPTFFGTNFSYDAARNRLVVGRPTSNIVSVLAVDTSSTSSSITGRITDAQNAPIAGITVEARNTQGLSHTGVTDSQGFYSVINLPAGDYTVRPLRNPLSGPAHYVYAPPTRTFPGLNADLFGANFTGTRVFDIQGRVTSSTAPGVGIFDVTITATGSSTATATTDANGNYRLQDLIPGGNYTVTASKSGFTFSPVDYSFTNLASDLSQADFTTASATFFTVSGRVANLNNTPIANVVITTLVTSMQGSRTQTTQTNANGEYSIPNLQAGGNYTITPSKANFIFSPVSRTFNNLSANQTLASFVAQGVVRISGRVTESGYPLSGVTITLSDAAAAVTTTDANGNYSFANLPSPDNYTVTPSKTHYSFAPAKLDFSAISIDQNSANFGATLLTYSISGKIGTVASGPVNGVTVALSGSSAADTATNQSGDYAFTNLDGSGNYTVTPSKVNYSFSPTSRTFNNLSANQTSASFLATRTGYSIRIFTYGPNSNSLGVGGVTVTVTGPTTATGFSNPFVTFNNLQPGGNYTVTPSQTGFRFFPTNRVFTNLSTDESGEFRRIPIYRVSGRVADTKGNGISGVAITVGVQGDPPPTGPGVTTTDAGGNYDFDFSPVVFDVSYAVYPSKAGYSFSPILFRNAAGVDIPGIRLGLFRDNQPVTAVANFLATHSISGRVTDSIGGVSGVTMTLSGQGAGTATTGVNGNYSFLNLVAGNDYTITPSKAGLAFAPASRSFTSLGANQTAVNFAAQAVHTGFEPAVLPTDQVELKTWTFQGKTYAHVKLLFPNGGYSVINWGQAVKSADDFATEATIERSIGASVQAVTTTAQIYDLGPLANGNYTFTFKNSGVLVKSLAFTVSSAVPPPNPIDDQRQFVRQQYLDFLNREPDTAGWDFWTDNITKCSDPARRPSGQTEAQCTTRQRETTSGAFFQSPEFQYTGYYVYRMYVGALGRPPKLSEFIPDAQFVANGIVVNGQLSAVKINQNKAAFAAQFVNCTDATKYRCAEFKAIYDGLNNTQYVDKLFETTGVNASANDRIDLVGSIGANTTRAGVLQKVVDGINVISEVNQQFTTTYGKAFYDQQFNRAFVELEYFGYMKRDPDDAGYAFWLGKLNSFNGSFVNAEMVLAFISSPEYRARFGQP